MCRSSKALKCSCAPVGAKLLLICSMPSMPLQSNAVRAYVQIRQRPLLAARCCVQNCHVDKIAIGVLVARVLLRRGARRRHAAGAAGGVVLRAAGAAGGYRPRPAASGHLQRARTPRRAVTCPAPRGERPPCSAPAPRPRPAASGHLQRARTPRRASTMQHKTPWKTPNLAEWLNNCEKPNRIITLWL